VPRPPPPPVTMAIWPSTRMDGKTRSTDVIVASVEGVFRQGLAQHSEHGGESSDDTGDLAGEQRIGISPHGAGDLEHGMDLFDLGRNGAHGFAPSGVWPA
jgi:hypothetical protein